MPNKVPLVAELRIQCVHFRTVCAFRMYNVYVLLIIGIQQKNIVYLQNPWYVCWYECRYVCFVFMLMHSGCCPHMGRSDQCCVLLREPSHNQITLLLSQHQWLMWSIVTAETQCDFKCQYFRGI